MEGVVRWKGVVAVVSTNKLKRIPNMIVAHHVADIRMDWKAYNYQEDTEKLVDLIVAYGRPFPLRDANGIEVIPTPPGESVDSVHMYCPQFQVLEHCTQAYTGMKQ